MTTPPTRVRVVSAVWICLALLGVSPSPLVAQGGAPASVRQRDTLDLQSVLRIAEEHSPLLQRLEARAAIARGELGTLSQWPNPTLEYRRENLGAPLLPDEFVTAYVPMDFTGRRISLGRAATRGRERVELARRAERRDVQLEIARVWMRAVLSSELEQMMRLHYLAVEEIAGIEAQRAREGVVAEAAAFRTRVEANRLSHETAMAEADAVRDRLSLASLLGVSAAELPRLPRLLSASIAPDMGGLFADTMTSDAQLLAAAQLARSELQAADLARDEARLRQRVETGSVLGDWQLQAGTKRTSGFMSGQVGLAVPLPLFNQNEGARARSAGVMRDAEAAVRAVQLQINGEVLAAADQWRRLHRVRDRMTETPPLGVQIATSARVAYVEGQMTLLERLDAERTAADAQRSALRFEADFLMARLTLMRAIGAPLIPGNTP